MPQVPVILGAFLIVVSIIAESFKVGLTTRTYVSAWQGRASLLLFGAGLLMVGLPHLLSFHLLSRCVCRMQPKSATVGMLEQSSGPVRHKANRPPRLWRV